MINKSVYICTVVLINRCFMNDDIRDWLIKKYKYKQRLILIEIRKEKGPLFVKMLGYAKRANKKGLPFWV